MFAVSAVGKTWAISMMNKTCELWCFLLFRAWNLRHAQRCGGTWGEWLKGNPMKIDPSFFCGAATYWHQEFFNDPIENRSVVWCWESWEYPSMIVQWISWKNCRRWPQIWRETWKTYEGTLSPLDDFCSRHYLLMVAWLFPKWCLAVFIGRRSEILFLCRPNRMARWRPATGSQCWMIKSHHCHDFQH